VRACVRAFSMGGFRDCHGIRNGLAPQDSSFVWCLPVPFKHCFTQAPGGSRRQVLHFKIQHYSGLMFIPFGMVEQSVLGPSVTGAHNPKTCFLVGYSLPNPSRDRTEHCPRGAMLYPTPPRFGRMRCGASSCGKSLHH